MPRITSYNVCYTKLLRLGFGWKTTLLVVPVLGVLAFAPLIVYFLGKHGMETAARAAAWIGYTWAGFIFFFLWTRNNFV